VLLYLMLQEKLSDSFLHIHELQNKVCGKNKWFFSNLLFAHSRSLFA